MAITTLCIALAIFYEARGEPQLGQVAVAQVILNRSASRGMNACEVLVEKGQFSFKPERYFKKQWHDGGYKLVLDESTLPTGKKGWENSVISAQLAQKQRNSMGNIEFFHAVYVQPAWGNRYRWVMRIGNHVFYARKVV